MINTKVKSLILPQQIPDLCVLNSDNHNASNFNSEMWEFEYVCNRYLKGLSNDELKIRHRDIIRNMLHLVRIDRNKLPINNCMGSWYWFRKEYQTRLELFFRNITIESDELFKRIWDLKKAHGADVRDPDILPNVLFRYEKSCYLDDIVKFGRIRIGPASKHIQGKDHARYDDELNKTIYLPPNSEAYMSDCNGRKISDIDGSIGITRSVDDYYIYCMSCDFHMNLIKEFIQSDTCMEVCDTDQFINCVMRGGDAALPNWLFNYGFVHYFDMKDKDPNEHIDPRMCKDFKYAYQREYRFVWASVGNTEHTDGYKFINIGPCNMRFRMHTFHD